MFYKHTGNDKVVVLIAYVVDIILTGNDETGMTIVKKIGNQFPNQRSRIIKILPKYGVC